MNSDLDPCDPFYRIGVRFKCTEIWDARAKSVEDLLQDDDQRLHFGFIDGLKTENKYSNVLDVSNRNLRRNYFSHAPLRRAILITYVFAIEGADLFQVLKQEEASEVFCQNHWTALAEY